MRNVEPPEFCDNDVVPGTEFCEKHTEEEPEDDDEPDFHSFQVCYESDFNFEGYLEEWH